MGCKNNGTPEKDDYKIVNEKIKSVLINRMALTKLFTNIQPDAVGDLLELIQPEFRQYIKDAYVYRCCVFADYIAVPLSGILHAVQSDDVDNRSIMPLPCQPQ